MAVITEFFTISSNGFSEVINITEQVADIVGDSGVTSGIATVFASGATAGITTTEYEPGLQRDIPEFLEKLAPSKRTYYHDKTWGDGNGFSHIRATFIGPSLTVPFSESRLLLGTWQQIIVIDCDNKARNRSIVVQVMGE